MRPCRGSGWPARSERSRSPDQVRLSSTSAVRASSTSDSRSAMLCLPALEPVRVTPPVLPQIRELAL
jgi:hypothetical protein